MRNIGKKGMIWILAFLFLFPISSPAFGDSVVIPVSPDISVYEPGQKAIVAWDGEKESLVLSIDVRAEKGSTAFRIIPLPSKPEIKKGDFESFERIQELIQKHAYALRSLLDVPTYPSKEIEIIFHKKIGAHDITVIKAEKSKEFKEWVKKFLEKKGINYVVSSHLEDLARNYLARDIKFFVLDIVKLNAEKKSVEPLIYEFKSNYLYYPLKISSVASGKTDIDLFTITEGRLNVISNPGLIPAFYIGPKKRPIEFRINEGELEDISPEVSKLFPSSAWVKAWGYNGSLKDLKEDFLATYTPPCFASFIEEFNPGDPIYNQAPIENILGPPDKGKWAEVLGAIGHLGEVTVGFDKPIVDMPGDDIRLWFGGFDDASERMEGFRVEGSFDGESFEQIAKSPIGKDLPPPVPLTYIGMDLAGSGFAKVGFLKIIDTGTDKAFKGLELNAVEAINTVISGEWVPYIPGPEQVEIRDLVKPGGNTFIEVTINFPTPGYLVISWGSVKRWNSGFFANARIERWTGAVIQVIPSPVKHQYYLGNLSPGEYAFKFEVWGEVVKKYFFKVPPYPFLDILSPTTEEPEEAGRSDNPHEIPILVKVRFPLHFLHEGETFKLNPVHISKELNPFKALIGGKEAEIIKVEWAGVDPENNPIPPGGRYKLTVLPPTQEKEGYYDLEVRFYPVRIWPQIFPPSFPIFISDLEEDAVHYSQVSIIHGKVKLQGRTDHSGAHVIAKSEEGRYFDSFTNQDGNFTLEVPPGIYVVFTQMDGYLTAKTRVEVKAGVSIISEVILLGGDANQDGIISKTDLVMIGEALNTAGGKADINGDGITDICDLALVGKNFGKEGPLP